MKKMFFLVSFIAVSSFAIHDAYAVKKYNASKSNTAVTSVAYGNITTMAEEAKLEALQIATQMLNQEQKSSGDVQVKATITIGVEIERVERVPKAKDPSVSEGGSGDL